MTKPYIFFKGLGFREKIACLVFAFMFSLMFWAFLNGKFITYTAEESRTARFFAEAEQKGIEKIDGFSLLKQLMSATPNKGWGTGFLFKYDHSNEDLIKALEARKWKYMGQFEESDYIKHTKFDKFCQKGVLLYVFLYDTYHSMGMEFDPDTCKSDETSIK